MKVKLVIVAFMLLWSTSFLVAFKVESMNSAGEYSALVKNLENSKELTVGVMKAMPSDKYSYKSSKDTRTFAEQVAHIAYATEGYSMMIMGKQPKWKLGDDTQLNKSQIIELIKRHFDTMISIAENRPRNDGYCQGWQVS